MIWNPLVVKWVLIPNSYFFHFNDVVAYIFKYCCSAMLLGCEFQTLAAAI